MKPAFFVNELAPSQTRPPLPSCHPSRNLLPPHPIALRLKGRNGSVKATCHLFWVSVTRSCSKMENKPRKARQYERLLKAEGPEKLVEVPVGTAPGEWPAVCPWTMSLKSRAGG